jgi:hypothetical protein
MVAVPFTSQLLAQPNHSCPRFRYSSVVIDHVARIMQTGLRPFDHWTAIVWVVDGAIKLLRCGYLRWRGEDHVREQCLSARAHGRPRRGVQQGIRGRHGRHTGDDQRRAGGPRTAVPKGRAAGKGQAGALSRRTDVGRVQDQGRGRRRDFDRGLPEIVRGDQVAETCEGSTC